ncbi:hypothetical protein Bca101_058822 [Brassica carinata]
MSGHTPFDHASINPYHIPPVLVRSIQGSYQTSHPWNFHETAFLHTSAFKAVSTIGSAFRPSTSSPG